MTNSNGLAARHTSAKGYTPSPHRHHRSAGSQRSWIPHRHLNRLFAAVAAAARPGFKSVNKDLHDLESGDDAVAREEERDEGTREVRAYGENRAEEDDGGAAEVG